MGPDGLPKITQEGKAYIGIKKRLDDVISKSNSPAAKVWREANEIWSDRTSIMEAREAGKRAWNPKYTHDQMLEDLSNLNGAERAAYKQAARASLEEHLNGSINGDTKVRDMLRTRSNQDKMRHLASRKGVDVEGFLNSMEHEAGYAQSHKGVKTSTQKQATQAMAEKMTPDFENTPAGRGFERASYGFHVTPLKQLPGYGTLKQHMIERLEKQHLAMREALGPLLTTQGPKAQEVARALLNYSPNKGGPTAGMAVAGLLRALAQPNLPPTPIPGYTNR